MSEAVSHETLCLTPAIMLQVEQRRAGRRQKVHHHGLLCSKCLEKPPAGPNDRYCRDCRAADRRDRRAAAKEINARNAAIAQGVAAVLAESENNKLSKGQDNERDQTRIPPPTPDAGEPGVNPGLRGERPASRP